MAESKINLPGNFDWRAITPDDSPMGLPDVEAHPVYRDLGSAKLLPGDPAFDFDLPLYDFSDGTRGETGDRFHLRAVAADRPVALVFGSYT